MGTDVVFRTSLLHPEISPSFSHSPDMVLVSRPEYMECISSLQCMHVAGSGGDDVVVRARRATRAHHAMDGSRHGQAPCFVVRVSHVAGAVMPYARANLELISHAVECMGISRCCISPSRSILCLSIVN